MTREELIEELVSFWHDKSERKLLDDTARDYVAKWRAAGLLHDRAECLEINQGWQGYKRRKQAERAQLIAERDALLPRLAELAEQAGKLRTAEWLRTCASLPPEEWPPAPAYKGPMVPAAELDALQARITEALQDLDAYDGPTAPAELPEGYDGENILGRVRAVLQGDQPTEKVPTS